MLENKTPLVPFALHLDHGASFEECLLSMNAGFTSVMFDGSSFLYEKNCQITSQVTTIASVLGVSVEGELGVIGGQESGLEASSTSLTDPEQAADFVQRTGIDCLAPSIGTAHGFYKGPVNLDIDRLKEIWKKTGVPLVLHGGSGVPIDHIHQAAKYGVAKMNFSTIVRKKFRDSLSIHMQKNPDDIDILSLLSVPIEACTEEIQAIMRVCKSSAGLKEIFSQK